MTAIHTVRHLMALLLIAAGVCATNAQWQDMGVPGSGGVYVLCAMGDTLFAGSSAGGVSVTTDRGMSWLPASNGLTTANVRALATHNGTLLAGTLGGGVFVSTDRGASWGPPGLGGRFVQALLSAGGKVFAGTDKGVFQSTDGGSSWSQANPGLVDLTITALAGSSGRIFAGTLGQGVFASDDAGLHWQPISAGIYTPTILSLLVSGDLLYAGTMGGGVVSLSDTSGRWSFQTSGIPGANVNALLGLETEMLAGTNSGTVYSAPVGWRPSDVIQQEIRDPASYNYLLFMPRNRSEERDGKLPLILFLHGIDALDGEVGGYSDLSKLKEEGLPVILDGNNDFAAIVVSPQCPAETEWYYTNVDNLQLMNRLLDSVIQRYPVDTNRIIITGLSMGGIGSYYFAIHSPTRFAAIAPCAARGEPDWDECAVLDSVWAFHGALDQTVPLSSGQAIINSLEACGVNPRFTVYPGVGHDCWTITYARPDLYEWMYRQRKH